MATDFLANEHLDVVTQRVGAHVSHQVSARGINSPSVRSGQIHPPLLDTPKVVNPVINADAIGDFSRTMIAATIEMVDKKNTLDAQNAFYEYDDKRRAMLNEYLKLSGKEALDQAENYKANLKQLVVDAGMEVSPATRAKLAPMLLISRRNDLDTMAGHQIQQFKVYEENTRVEGLLNMDKQLAEIEDPKLAIAYIDERAWALYPKDTPQDAVRRQVLRESKILSFGESLMRKHGARAGMAFFQEYKKRLGQDSSTKADDLIRAQVSRENQDEELKRADDRRKKEDAHDYIMQRSLDNFRKGISFAQQKEVIEDMMTKGILSIGERNSLENYFDENYGGSGFDSDEYWELSKQIISANTENRELIHQAIAASGLKKGPKQVLIDRLLLKSENAKGIDEQNMAERWGNQLQIMYGANTKSISDSLPGASGNKAAVTQASFELNEMLAEYRTRTAGKTSEEAFVIASQIEDRYISKDRFKDVVNLDTLPPLRAEISGLSKVDSLETLDAARDSLMQAVGSGQFSLNEIQRETSTLNFYAKSLSVNGALRTPTQPGELPWQPAKPQAQARPVEEDKTKPEQTYMDEFGIETPVTPEWQAFTETGKTFTTAYATMMKSLYNDLAYGKMPSDETITKQDTMLKAWDEMAASFKGILTNETKRAEEEGITVQQLRRRDAFERERFFEPLTGNSVTKNVVDFLTGTSEALSSSEGLPLGLLRALDKKVGIAGMKAEEAVSYLRARYSDDALVDIKSLRDYFSGGWTSAIDEIKQSNKQFISELTAAGRQALKDKEKREGK